MVCVECFVVFLSVFLVFVSGLVRFRVGLGLGLGFGVRVRVRGSG